MGLILHFPTVECLKEIFTGAGRDRDQNNLAEAESCPSPGTSSKMGDGGCMLAREGGCAWLGVP